MQKTFAFFAVVFVMAAIICSIAEGGGFAATQLTDNVSANATALHVQSTEGFLDSDWVWVGDEKIAYSSTNDTAFIVTVSGNATGRGYDGTDAEAHVVGSRVFSEETGAINIALGFNTATVQAPSGAFTVPVLAFKFFTVTLPKLLMWDFSVLKVGAMVYIRWMLLGVSLGLVAMVGIMAWQTATTILG